MLLEEKCKQYTPCLLFDTRPGPQIGVALAKTSCLWLLPSTVLGSLAGFVLCADVAQRIISLGEMCKQIYHKTFIGIRLVLSLRLWLLSLIGFLKLSFLIVIFQSLICPAHQLYEPFLHLYRGRLNATKSVQGLGSFSHCFTSFSFFHFPPPPIFLESHLQLPLTYFSRVVNFFRYVTQSLWSDGTEPNQNLCKWTVTLWVDAFSSSGLCRSSTVQVHLRKCRKQLRGQAIAHSSYLLQCTGVTICEG